MRDKFIETPHHRYAELLPWEKPFNEYSQDWQKNGTGHWWMLEYLQPNISL